MANGDPLPAADLAWSEKVARLAADALLAAKALEAQQYNRAVHVVANEVFNLLQTGDRPAS